IEFRDRKLCTLDGVVFNSCAIQSSLRPSSTQRRIFDACGFRATLLVPTAPCSFDHPSFIVHMYHFLLPDARCILPPRGKPPKVPRPASTAFGGDSGCWSGVPVTSGRDPEDGLERRGSPRSRRRVRPPEPRR